MITARTVCFVCFVLFLGTTHANNKKENNSSVTSTASTSHETISQTSNAPNSDCVCTPSTTKQIQEATTKQKQESSQGYCILFLPKKNTLFLVVGALAVACIVLLLTSLICAWQICHLKVFMSRFQPHHSNVDLYAMKNRSESPFRDDGQAVMEPTETCPMLSVVTTHEEKNKKESTQPNTEPPVEGPNGDVAQEEGNGCEAENQEPDVGAPEDSAIEV